MSTKVKESRRIKREQAKDRQAVWDKMTPKERLRSLDTRPGASKKERAKLFKALEELKEKITK